MAKPLYSSAVCLAIWARSPTNEGHIKLILTFADCNLKDNGKGLDTCYSAAYT